MPEQTTEPTSIYAACLAAGIPMSNHYSDLYIPANEQTREILKRFGKKVDGWSVTTFHNQAEGGTWYDVPFSYLPFWEAKQGENARREWTGGRADGNSH